MKKIRMTTPLVEMDGDEMTRILWQMIKRELILPFVSLRTEYYDLGLPERERTRDRVTLESAEATKKYGVAVKCATITPNRARMEEYQLSELWKSPNATIRAALDGTVFRTPILLEAIRPAVRSWRRPITVARHAYGDLYRATEYRVRGRGRGELLFTGEGDEQFRKTVYDFEGPGVLQAQYNKDASILSFAHACFRYALSAGLDLWFSTKDTVSGEYDQTFKLLFEELYEREYQAAFREKGIRYFYTLIDDAVARMIRSEGGFVLACKNYDGDVMSDMISAAFGSLAMMTSVLVSPDGKFEYEAAHGTVTRHYYRYLQGEETSTNPMATIYAWSGALRKRGELDGLSDLVGFADRLEGACMDTLQAGIVTGDLLPLMTPGQPARSVSTLAFLSEVGGRLRAAYGA